MVLLLGLGWWYSSGWRWAWQRIFIDRLHWVSETFSVRDMLRTLFAPFRQTFAGDVRGSLDAKLRAALDKLVSRAIGFIIRSVLLVMAAVCAVVVIAVALILLILWPLLPMLPILSVILLATGAGA